MIKDYLFVDSKRLNMYYEQVAEPVSYDKVSEWKAGLAITGPKVGVAQTRHPRDPTQSEKITRLISELRKQRCLMDHRPCKEKEPPKFVLESCTATRLIVPGSGRAEIVTADIAIWISRPNSSDTESDVKPGLLCLFEAYQGDDKNETPKGSEFSLFVSLMYSMHQDARNALLLKNIGVPDLDKASFEATWEMSKKYIEAFHQDPVGTLSNLGCRPAVSRGIEVLYKVREFDIDWATYYKTASVFGYPIYIAAV